MKTLLTSTALLLIGVNAAVADGHAASFAQSLEDAGLSMGDLAGVPVYRSDDAVDPAAGLSDDWDEAGEVAEAVLDEDGAVVGLVAEIGGFLGFGEDTILLDVGDLTVLANDGAPVVVVTTDAAALEDAEPYDAAAAADAGDGADAAESGDADAAPAAEADAAEPDGEAAEEPAEDASAEDGEATEAEDGADGAVAEEDGEAAEAEGEQADGGEASEDAGDAPEGAEAQAEGEDQQETTPEVDGEAEDARTAGAIAVDNEGSGVTTQDSAGTATVETGTPVTQMGAQQAVAPPSTNTPDLDDGTEVDNEQTPATAEVEGDQVETEGTVEDGAEADGGDAAAEDAGSGEAEAGTQDGDAESGAEDGAEAEGGQADAEGDAEADGDEAAAAPADADAEAGSEDGETTEAAADDGTDADVAPEAEAEMTAETDGGAEDGGAEAPAVEREGYATVLHDDIDLVQLKGVPVFGEDDEEIGTIGYTASTGPRGKEADLAILNIGGFLGIGDHEVALPVETITFLDGEDGMRGYVSATRDDLEAMPAYEE